MSIVLLFVHILEYLLLMYIIIHTRVAHWAQAQFTLLTVCSYYLYKTSSLMSTYKDPLLYNYRHALHIIPLSSQYISKWTFYLDFG